MYIDCWSVNTSEGNSVVSFTGNSRYFLTGTHILTHVDMHVAMEENQVCAVHHLVTIVVLLLKDTLYCILKLPLEGKLLQQNILKLNKKDHKIQTLGPCDLFSCIELGTSLLLVFSAAGFPAGELQKPFFWGTEYPRWVLHQGTSYIWKWEIMGKGTGNRHRKGMEKTTVLLQMTNRNTVFSFCRESLALGLCVLPCYILLFVLKNQIRKTAALCDNFALGAVHVAVVLNWWLISHRNR